MLPRPAYAGIGSRRTPADVLARMRALAGDLERLGYVLRSGGAEGADTHFEIGVRDRANTEIHLPWKGFRGHGSPHYGACPDALALAARHHPNWKACGPRARLLYARNGYQVLGRGLDSPAAFVVCWTPRGEVAGGTGQALRIAKVYGVEVFNLADASTEEWLREAVMRG